MSTASLYDTDIYAWSEQQAEALRRLAARRDLGNELDLERIAQEIADVGQGELREVRVLLGKALAQLVVAWAAPDADPEHTWTSNLISWLSEAALRFTPAMHNYMNLSDLWSSALRQAIRRFEIGLDRVPAKRAMRLEGSECPFSASYLLGDDFQIRRALERLESIQAPPATG
jgi:hypothetical protein